VVRNPSRRWSLVASLKAPDVLLPRPVKPQRARTSAIRAFPEMVRLGVADGALEFSQSSSSSRSWKSCCALCGALRGTKDRGWAFGEMSMPPRLRTRLRYTLARCFGESPIDGPLVLPPLPDCPENRTDRHLVALCASLPAADALGINRQMGSWPAEKERVVTAGGGNH
jgi:hypothetical protein